MRKIPPLEVSEILSGLGSKEPMVRQRWRNGNETTKETDPVGRRDRSEIIVLMSLRGDLHETESEVGKWGRVGIQIDLICVISLINSWSDEVVGD